MRRFIIQEATFTEFDSLRQFYIDNPDEHVMFRDDKAVKQAIDEGVFLIAQDTGRPLDDRIFAASAVYTVGAVDGAGSELTLKEAGGSNVAEAYRGFGVHKVFHWARSLHKFITEPDGFDHYFGAIICPNPASEANIAKAGFKPWGQPPQSLIDDRAPYAKDGQHISYFRLPYTAIQHHAQSLLMVANRGLLERKGPNGELEQVELLLNLESLNYFRPTLERAANGDFAEFEDYLRPSNRHFKEEAA